MNDRVADRLNRFLSRRPSVPKTCFVAPSAVLIGAVSLGEETSIWYQAVVRADINSITIGNRTNIQDGAVLHVANDFPLTIGEEVNCGHQAVLHACTIEDRVLIGIGAIILDGAVIGHDSIVGAGALVTKGTAIPPGSLVLGSPARVIRTLTREEKASISQLAQKYVEVARFYGDRGSTVN
jgi:carbonic anhydrase/acetyltransferase-like protein (isoleucine patch superfamily)